MILSAPQQLPQRKYLHRSMQESSGSVESVLFSLLCLFLLSQSYLVPLAAIGPSWAVWPDLSDIVIACMAVVLPWRSSRLLTSEARRLAVFGWVTLALWTASLCVVTLYALPRIGFYPLPADPSKARGAGVTELYRMVQCQCVLLSAVSVRWTRGRLAVLGWISCVLWIATAGFVLLTFSGLVSTELLSHGLPADVSLSGPWGAYISLVIPAWGQ